MPARYAEVEQKHINNVGTDVLAECFYCGRRFPQLYKLTAEDIGREHPPPEAFQLACAECLEKVRSISLLIPEQGFRQTARDLSLMVPAFSALLVLVALGTSIIRIQGLGELGLFSQWLGTAAILFGILMVWDRTKNRYAMTHDLKWTLTSKRVNLAIAVVLAGIIVSIVSTQFAR